MPTRFGREIVSKQCTNKECRGLQRTGRMQSMDDIGSKDYVNCYCHYCGCHYAGNVGEKLKFWTKKEWDDAIEKA